ncbi:MAG: SDR family NAD(P)-dependent oxidoreductase [Candidatus Acidiferrales bacterium]
MNPGDLSNKVAIVTGGARGIGKAIAQGLAEAGASVMIGDLRGEEAGAAAKEIQRQSGRPVVAMQADVSKLDDMRALTKAVIEKFGRIDILVNNAGWDQLMPFLKTTPELWNRIIGINYLGVIHACHAVLPHMVERKQGSIVNISSDSARVGSMGESIYSGAKAAVVTFSKTLAREHARDNIRVNVICPGLADTPLLDEIRREEFGGKILGSVVNHIPLKRLAKPEDIAPMAVLLASDATSYVTGQVVSINGGLTMVG